MLETKRLLLKSPYEVTGKMLSCYYMNNCEFLKSFEPIREELFYTDEYQECVLKSQRDDWKSQKSCHFYICMKDEPSQVIGIVALNNIIKGIFCSCFLGYQLDEKHMNQGYMSEAILKVVRFAFDELKLHRIEANIMPKNNASIAVIKKCGFVDEGISRKYMKINGVWEDHIHYVMFNEDIE